MSVILLLALAAVASDDPGGVVMTAPRDNSFVPQAPAEPVETSEVEPAPHGMTTEEQIESYLAAGRDAERRQRDLDRYADADLDALPAYDRRTLVEAGYAVGSHGYQAYHATVVTQLNDNVTLGLHYSKSEGGRGGYYGYAPGYDYTGIRDRHSLGARSFASPTSGATTTVGASLRVDWSDDDAPRRNVRQR